MIIKFVRDFENGLHKEANNSAGSLTLNKHYVVQAAFINSDGEWFCVYDDANIFYPFWKPSCLFEITNPSLSKYWVYKSGYFEDKKSLLLCFPEWASNENYYEDLLEGEYHGPIAQIFRKYKDLMYLEFPDPNVKETAQIGNEQWLICPDCLDAWESSESQDALVCCPKCEKVLNNPRYKKSGAG